MIRGFTADGIARSFALGLVKTYGYTAQWISSVRNGMLRNCVFGTYRAAQPKFLESRVAAQPDDLQRLRPRPLCPVRTRPTIEWNWVDSQLLRQIDCSLHYKFCFL